MLDLDRELEPVEEIHALPLREGEDAGERVVLREGDPVKLGDGETDIEEDAHRLTLVVRVTLLTGLDDVERDEEWESDLRLVIDNVLDLHALTLCDREGLTEVVRVTLGDPDLLGEGVLEFDNEVLTVAHAFAEKERAREMEGDHEKVRKLLREDTSDGEGAMEADGREEVETEKEEVPLVDGERVSEGVPEEHTLIEGDAVPETETEGVLLDELESELHAEREMGLPEGERERVPEVETPMLRVRLSTVGETVPHREGDGVSEGESDAERLREGDAVAEGDREGVGETEEHVDTDADEQELVLTEPEVEAEAEAEGETEGERDIVAAVVEDKDLLAVAVEDRLEVDDLDDCPVREELRMELFEGEGECDGLIETERETVDEGESDGLIELERETVGD